MMKVVLTIGRSDTLCASGMISVHPRWLRYRIQTCNRKSTVYRQDSDWKKYYLNEPLSQEIINKPLNELKRTEIKAWACPIIRKYKLTSSAWGNIKSIMDQMYEYLNDSEELDYNPLKTLNIDSRLFRKTAKNQLQRRYFMLRK